MAHIKRPKAVEGSEQDARNALWETAAKGKLDLNKHLIALNRFPKKKMLTAVFDRGSQRLKMTTYWTGESQ
jgi:hypothetical protein